MDRITFQGFGGLRLSADSFGESDARPVLLLPAIGQTKEMCHGAAVALADSGRRAICLDLRGHGDSESARDGRYDLDAYASDLRVVLAQMGARASVVAAGASGLAALLALGEPGPALASALVLVGTTAWADAETSARIRKALIARMETFSTADEVLACVAAMHPFEPQPRATEKLLQAFTQGEDGLFRWRCDHRVLTASVLDEIAGKLADVAGRVTIPTLLVRGTANETVSAEATERLREMIPGAERAEIEGGGHYVATDLEDEYNATLLAFLERSAPREPLTFQGGADPRILRDALGCFGTGVTIVTTLDGQGEPIGLTANSFTSVSLDPALILFCLAKGSANLETFKSVEGFAINVLHIGQQPASNRFARRDGSRFDDVDWEVRNDGGSPILTGSLASFDCRTHAVHDGGDHLIFVGEITHAYYEPHRDPLLYFRGKYHRLHFA